MPPVVVLSSPALLLLLPPEDDVVSSTPVLDDVDEPVLDPGPLEPTALVELPSAVVEVPAVDSSEAVPSSPHAIRGSTAKGAVRTIQREKAMAQG